MLCCWEPIRAYIWKQCFCFMYYLLFNGGFCISCSRYNDVTIYHTLRHPDSQNTTNTSQETALQYKYFVQKPSLQLRFNKTALFVWNISMFFIAFNLNMLSILKVWKAFSRIKYLYFFTLTFSSRDLSGKQWV